jgi:DNA-binding NtrC family response regulator
MNNQEEFRKKVLVVDDEANVRDALRLILERNYDVDVAENGEQALLQLESYSEAESQELTFPDLVLLDLVMPGFDGLNLLEKMKAEYPLLPVIMLTATKTVKTAVQAMKIGAVDYLNKPYDVDELLSLIEETIAEGATGKTAPNTVVTKRHQRPDMPNIEGDFGCLVGTHPLMAEVYRKIEQVAIRDTTVLITGESGTGKELVAREIHKRSKRNTGPFIAINCAAIPETLIESELFGHEKGSFTNAIDRRVGLFELADGGTLFLDEIGELSMPVQVKMLRFLQDQEFYRVGRSKPIKVDVRILVATNASLETAIKEMRFRQDLYYRVNVVSIEVPPLRDRPEDIPAMVRHFVKRLSPLYADKNPNITDEAIDVLCKYNWPGNVRELENVTESILALSSSDEITDSHLPSRLKERKSDGSLSEDVLAGNIPFEEAERAFEKDIILQALQRTNFVQTRAAELLGISRRILKYKMDKLGIRENPEGLIN